MAKFMSLTNRFGKVKAVQFLPVVFFVVICVIIPDRLWAQTFSAPKQLKLNAITTLEQISTTDRRLKRTLDRAIKDIGRSLSYRGYSLFIDDFRIVPPPDGEKVFREEQEAVERLLRAIKRRRTPDDIKLVIQQAIDKLVEADRGIAALSIATAQHLVQVGVGDPRKLAKAQREFGKALQETNPRKAIIWFKKAWESSQEVVDGTELLIKNYYNFPDPFSPSLATNTLSATFQIHVKGKHHKDDDRGKTNDRDDDDDDQGNKHGRGYKDDDRDKKHRRGDKDDKEKNEDKLVLEFIEIIQDSSGAIIRTLTTEYEVPRIPRRHKNRFVDLTVTSVWDGKNEEGETVPDGTYSYIVFGNLVKARSGWKKGDHRSPRRWHKFVKPGYRKGRYYKEIEATSFPVTGTVLLDNTPPEITAAVSPTPNAAGWNNTDATVSFDCTDSGSGIATCPSPIDVTSEGAAQVIEVTATDAAGNSTTTSVTVNIDKTAPSINASQSPLPNANGWNNSDVTVSFNCADGTSGVTTCPDPVVVTTEGTGQVVTGTAEDVAGNMASTSVTLKIDRTPPQVSAVINPSPNLSGWNNSEVTINFPATDNLSGVAATTAPITLSPEGANQIVNGTATDRAGNSTEASVAVNIDKTPPSVIITNPADGVTLNTSPVTVSGTITEALSGIVSVTCNGILAVFSDSTFSCDVSLTEGDNSIVVEATDFAGNVSSSSINVVFGQGVAVNITSPENLSLVNSSPINVSGSISSNATVVVNDIPAIVTGSTFGVTVPLKEGNNTITAVAKDPLGEVATASIQVTLDTTPPRVTIDSPPDGFVTGNPLVTVTGMINDIVVGTVNGEQAQSPAITKQVPSARNSPSRW
jgi:hypothetical protein